MSWSPFLRALSCALLVAGGLGFDLRPASAQPAKPRGDDPRTGPSSSDPTGSDPTGTGPSRTGPSRTGPSRSGTSGSGLPSTRLVPVGEFEIEFYAPAWASGDPVARIDEAIEREQFDLASDLLDRIVADAPTAHLPAANPAKWRFGDIVLPTDARLRNWWSGLTENAQSRLRVREIRSHRIESALDPRLWHPGSADEARRTLARAWETGDLETVSHLARAGFGSDAVRAWIERRSAEADQRSESTADAPRASTPTATPRRAPSRPGRTATGLRYVQEPRPLLNVSKTPTHRGGTSKRGVSLRRMPLSAIYPVVTADAFIVDRGNATTAFSRDSLRVLWEMPAEAYGIDASSPTLPIPPVLTAVLPDGGYMTRVRTRRQGVARAPIQDLFRDDPKLPFERLFILDSPKTGEASPPTRRTEIALPGSEEFAWTPCGPVVPDGDRLYAPFSRGLTRIEIAVAAFDARNGRVLWSRVLGARSMPFLNEADTRGLLPETRVHLFRGDLHIETGLGWLHRIGTRNGEDRGAIGLPRLTPRLLHRSGSIGSISTPTFEDPRPRYPSPPIFVEEFGRALWISLASDSTHLVAIDLDAWEIEWSQPANGTTFIAGVVDSGASAREILLIDAGIEVRKRELGVLGRPTSTSGPSAPAARFIDFGGRHTRLARMTVSTDERGEDRRFSRDHPHEATLLTGVPSLVGDELWVPSIRGIEIWEVAKLGRAETGSDGGSRLADRVLDWPRHPKNDTLAGGTVFSVEGDRIATIQRGQVDLRADSSLHLLELVYPETPPPTTPDDE